MIGVEVHSDGFGEGIGGGNGDWSAGLGLKDVIWARVGARWGSDQQVGEVGTAQRVHTKKGPVKRGQVVLFVEKEHNNEGCDGAEEAEKAGPSAQGRGVRKQRSGALIWWFGK